MKKNIIDKQYIISERAHLMWPNMFFGIKITVDASFDKDRTNNTLHMLENAHPFLKSYIAYDTSAGKYFYQYQPLLHMNYEIRDNASSWQQYYKECTQDGWDAMHNSLLKLIVIPETDKFDCIFIAHHLLGDGRALLGLVVEFVDIYVGSQRDVKVAPEHLITSIHDLPAKSDLPWISKVIINSANKTWKKENQTVRYEDYLKFEKEFIYNNPVTYEVEKIEKMKLEEIHKECKKAGVSINDYLVAEMMIKEQVNRLVIAADIRNELNCYIENSLGNYSTAFSVKAKKKTDSIVELAKYVSRNIKKTRSNPRKSMLVLACYFRMIPELIDAAVISTIGDFPSEAGYFVGSKLFGFEKRDGVSISNLGNINHKNILEGMFIPAASPANKRMMGVLSVNGIMNKCIVEYCKK